MILDERPPAGVGDAAPPTSRRDPWPLVVLGLSLALIAQAAAHLRFSYDAWWHLRSGDLMLDQHEIPSQDPFAWTAAGRPWRLNSWLYDVLVALLRRAGGTGVLVVVTLTTVFVFGAACYVLARRAGARPWTAVATATLLTYLLTPLVAERPQQLSFLLFAASLMLAPAALHGSNRALAGLVGIFVVWVNLHFAFTAGVLLVGLLAVATTIEDRSGRRPALVMGAVMLAGLVNPFGWRAYGAAWQTRETSKVIEEWERLSLTTFRDIVFMIVIGLTIASLWRTGRWRRLESLLPVAVFSFLAIDAVRNVPYLLLIAAAELGLACSSLRLDHLRRWLGPRSRVLVHGSALGLAALVLFSLPSLADARPAGSDVNPVRTTEAIPAGCRLLNQFEFGGYISDRRWPDVLVSMDGRNGSEQGFAEQRDVIDGRSGATDWVDRHGVDCVLVRPESGLVDQLLDAGWHRASSEPSAVLLLRP